ncbi:MAG TPA: hypothetical protein ENG59_06110 [Chloroflexi bacterium]|nr:hypothetical protein [Chloroflexota bacterium]
MTTRRRLYPLALPILVLAIAILACGTGYKTSTRIYGLSGVVRVQIKEANGVYTNSIEINEDWSQERFSATVTLSVSAGSCRAILSGNENTSIILDVGEGSPTEAYGDLVTDSFGEVSLETDCQDAQNLDLTINFTLK